jgi:putative flippase GtrA
MSDLKKELKRFIVAGVSAVATDLGAYYLLLNFFNVNLAKGISFVCGATVAFIINKYWTFEKKEKSIHELIKFAFLYLGTLGMNILTNHIVLDISNIVLLGFLTATGVSTVLNFVGQKWWVFK